jgi:hypothetical protein
MALAEGVRFKSSYMAWRRSISRRSGRQARSADAINSAVRVEPAIAQRED